MNTYCGDIERDVYRELFGRYVDNILESPTHYLFEKFRDPFERIQKVCVNDVERYYDRCRQIADMPKEVFVNGVIDVFNEERNSFRKELKRVQMNYLDSIPETFIEGYLAMRKG